MSSEKSFLVDQGVNKYLKNLEKSGYFINIINKNVSGNCCIGKVYFQKKKEKKVKLQSS